MTRSELEGRLRRAAVAYERAGPTSPNLERRILARVAATPREQGRRSWQRQLLATAAAIAFALGVAILIREARLNSEGPVAPGPRPLVINWSWGVPQLGFSSSTQGWALTGNTLLVTADAGRHWRDVSPQGTSSSCCTAYFLDGRRGWAGGGWYSRQFHDNLGLPIFRTTDGGATWKLIGRAGGQPSQSASTPTLDFVDEHHGWLIYSDSTADGTRIGRLQRTTDSGATWTSPQLLPAPVSYYNSADWPPKAWIRFIDPATGWYIAQDPNHYGGHVLYVTFDGGATWQQQAVPVPPEASADANQIALPAFVDDRVNSEMVLPVTLAGGRVLLDFSDDRGRTWKMDATRAPLFSRGLAVSDQPLMVPTWVGNGVIALVVGDAIEVNTGSGWTRIQPRGPKAPIGQIEFANPQVGWSLSLRPCPSDYCPFGAGLALMETTDGGHTWRPVGG